MTIPRILIIAGSDSGGGAGIQADIKTVTMLGGHAMTAITAITAQNTLGVDAVHPVPTDMVIAQIDSVVRDIGVDAVKIGMIGSAETAHAVADRLATFGVPIVFDPVMVATSGSVLADADTIAAFERLMALASVVTPNTPELGALAGMTVETELDQAAAAECVITRTGCPAVLAKGGHLVLDGEISGVDREGRHCRHKNSERVFDFLYWLDADGWHEMSWNDARIETNHTHGTGCTFASALAVGLAEGRPLEDGISRARQFVRAALISAPGLGGGHGPMGHALGVSPFDALEG
ncbi:bifunctional hydroxymethylpyrimidine kinase/phosphomethylpyrimidine kinase [Sphingomonas sp. AX6]|uniref:bifunctional hydroxymethylpyrimidine kinase/phosphomethylpyrimidine kinase n=1 Tax=Sphingomonas sp. AX6 TaxID=2653171 RepID=UPI0012F325CF|nr:bifunctional hydroxymethylpyrimidine kinase/phosphomethylpyrimidine kinase [Sphingomonas sp. AX6]VXC57008.1 Hydroxymethylpyrimidine/phosphomethylpyrimidine kinase [Sphingomonas sp. AX6]